jgi:hypothetical protein
MHSAFIEYIYHSLIVREKLDNRILLSVHNDSKEGGAFSAGNSLHGARERVIHAP